MTFLNKTFNQKNYQFKTPEIKERSVVLLTIGSRKIYNKGNGELNKHPLDNLFVHPHLQAINYYRQTSTGEVNHFFVNTCQSLVSNGIRINYDIPEWKAKNLFNSTAKTATPEQLWRNYNKYDYIVKNGKKITIKPIEQLDLLSDLPNKEEISKIKKCNNLKIVINGEGSHDTIYRFPQAPYEVPLNERTIGAKEIDEVIDCTIKTIKQSGAKNVKVVLNSCRSGEIRKSDNTSVAGYVKYKIEKALTKEKLDVHLDVKGINGRMMPFACPSEDGSILAVNNLMAKGMQTFENVEPKNVLTKQRDKYTKNHNIEPQSLMCSIV